MKILVEQSTILLSATPVSPAGTIRWMSPELLLGRNSSPTRQSDCYALGMVIYEVGPLTPSGNPPFTHYQVLTGLPPFHNLSSFAAVIAVQKGGRPKKPPNAKSLGFSDALWGLVIMCWNKSSTTRPTARRLLHCLQDASQTWVPPPEYPISDGLGRGAGRGPTSDGERSGATSTRAGGLFAHIVGVLRALVLPCTQASRTLVS